MNITIIGTGNMARGIATRALEGGHGVTLLGTEQAKAEALAAELPGEAQAGAVGDPLSGDVVVLAVWYQAVPDVLARYGDQLDGRVVVDITNPVDPETYAPLTVEAGSVAQEIAATVPGAKVVKAFNTTFAGTLAEGQVAGTQIDVFLASDDAAAKAAVSQLAGKVVVDITNPVDPDTYAPLTVEAGSVAQEIASTVPGAKVVKAFNTTFAGTLVEGSVAGTPLDVFVAGDDDEAKSVVAQLATNGGLRAIDVGPLALAHQLEGAGYLNMAVQPALGTNYGSALKIVA